MAELAKLEDLPADYVRELHASSVTPLWPMMRNVLPYHKPEPITKPGHWNYQKLRPLLMRAGDLTPVEKAERRVLVLSDPGRGKGAMQATATIYLGLQLLLPGEIAPCHVHTPSAVRIMIEGKGAYTVVDGEKLPMEDGDLVMTPSNLWHDHGHEGQGAVIWLDVLDLPIFYYLEGTYSIEGELQTPKNRPDASSVEYVAHGLVPSRQSYKADSAFPMKRFPWHRTEAALRSMMGYGKQEDIAELDFVNPQNGQDILPTLGFSALMLKAGATMIPITASPSASFHIVKGEGVSIINGQRIEWGPKDCFSAPVFASIEHHASKESFIIKTHDRPLQEKLGYYEERP